MSERLSHRLTEMFMLYEYGRQTPLASAEEYARAPQMARETYINDPILHARVNSLVAHTLKIIKEDRP